MRVVTCNGCFDGITPAHIFLFGYALAHGDVLIVGINSDEYIRKNKRNSPFHSEDERISSLKKLGFVERVEVFQESDPRDFIRRVKPVAHCIGAEYMGKAVEEVVCMELGIELVYVPIVRKSVWSSSFMKGESVL